MKVIKRNGEEVDFELGKVIAAISRANDEVAQSSQISEIGIKAIAATVLAKCETYGRAVGVEEIQELVEDAIMSASAYDVAKRYIRYRYEHSLRRNRNTIDDTVMSLVEYKNEDVKQENSNKNPEIIPTQRDYIAGEVSKDLTMRVLLPPDIADAHKNGIIHFHDSDYFIQHSHNCDLVDLEDMLQHGTVISGTMIERPHMFSTACNIATQIIAQVASCQYGGQSISLAHLAPFVNDSRKKFTQTHTALRNKLSEEDFNALINRLVHEDIVKGVQTIQYQVVTLMTTNGQAPFITVYMNLGEAQDDQTRKDLADIIEEVLLQRIQGVKNEAGQWITPAFPKLIYALDENNVYEGSEYYYLTELAAQCTAKRMVPDYISNKVMRELKKGDAYTCMGCRSFLTPYKDPETGESKYYGRLTA